MAKVISVLVIVFILAVVGFFVFKSQTPTTYNPTTPPTQTQTTQTLTPSPTQSASTSAQVMTYTNTKNNFSINLPAGWVYREYDTGDGAGFRPANTPNDPQYEYINIQIMPKPGSLANTPFATYVKTAASQEIQNYQSQVSSKQINAHSGIVGYETTWKVTPLGGSGPTTSLPITYFPAENNNTSTIQVNLQNGDYLSQYESILPTFNY